MAVDVFPGCAWSSDFEWLDEDGAPRVEAVGSTVSAWIIHQLTRNIIVSASVTWTNEALAQGSISLTAADTLLIPEGNVSELIIKVNSGGQDYVIYDRENDDGLNGVIIQ